MLVETISRVRRNHGLEHATIHVLSGIKRPFSAQGNSDHRGFSLNIYGDVSDEQVKAAVEEALRRLRNGERELAVHPNCGTALVTTAALTTLAVALAFGVESKRTGDSPGDIGVFLSAGPSAVLLAVLANIVSKPLGLKLQRDFTTDGRVAEMQVVRIQRVAPSLVTRLFHFLLAGGSKTMQPNAYRIETRN